MFYIVKAIVAFDSLSAAISLPPTEAAPPGAIGPNGIIECVSLSVILTVLNEGEAVRGVLESLCAQTRCPDEVVIADGGSRDRTVAILEAYTTRLPLRVISAPGSNISQGRNA